MTNPIEPFLQRTRVAYFSMEIALRLDMHTYSGGLGVGGRRKTAPAGSCRG